MGVLRIAGFTGMWPKRDPRALPDNAAVYSENIRVDGGQYLGGISGNTYIGTLAGATQTVFRIPLPGANTLANSYWMQFADIDTDVVRGPLVNDSYERYYWASPSTGLVYASKANIISGGAQYQSGVEAPTTAATVTVIGGSGELEDGEPVAPEETRVYTFTFINQYGEESQPGPTTEAVGYADHDYSVTSVPQPPATSGEAPYSTIRVYRTVSGATGNTGFYKVVDLAVGTTFFTDNYSHAIVTGQTPMESAGWAIAPAIHGLVLMPNGIMVGFLGNDIYFSENFRPHAWPAEYKITMDFPVVGLGVVGSTCVVATTGNPAIISGVKANSMAFTKVGQPLPCLSRRSIVATPQGVLWATHEGLAYVGPSGAGIATAEVIDHEYWLDNYNPFIHRAMFFENQYVAALGGTQWGFAVNPGNPTTLGVTAHSSSIAYDNIGVEPWTGKAWGIGTDNNLYELFVPGNDPVDYVWKSKEYTYPRPTNFSVFQVHFDDTTSDDLHVKVWATLRGNDHSVAKVLVFDQDIAESGKERRLPSGFKSDVWQIELSGTAEVQNFVMASSVAELRGV